MRTALTLYVLQVYRAQSNFVVQLLLMILHLLIAASIYPVHTRTYNMESTGRKEKRTQYRAPNDPVL